MIFTSLKPGQASLQPDVGQVMAQVVYALLPGTLTLLWFFGWGVITNLLLALGFAVLLEALLLKLRQRPLQPFLTDFSAVVTGWLLAVALPPYSPWWLILIAMLFAIVLAKHLYGGLGYNPFNPAMVGYAAMLVSFPLEMTLWPSPELAGFANIGLGDTLHKVFVADLATWDAVTQATPLDVLRTQLHQGQTLEAIKTSAGFGLLGGQGWVAVNLAWLAGGLWLLYRGIIQWEIPVGLLGALGLMAGVFWLLDSQAYASPLFHLFSGATMLGAFFIATDPVSASTTPLGKLLYAGGIGLLIYIIRSWGAYPDAVAFSVLIMNMAVPLLDYYTQPRVYGHRRWFGP